MKKVLNFPTAKIASTVMGMEYKLRALKKELDSMIEYHGIKEPPQMELFRGYSLEQLLEVADVILPALNRADMMLEVMELQLLDYEAKKGAESRDAALQNMLDEILKARLYYVDSIAGKAFDAFEREMRHYHKLGGTPLFEDA